MTSKESNVPVYTPGEFIELNTLRTFSKLTPWRSYLDILFQYAAITIAILLSEYCGMWWVTLICILFIGARIYALGILLHEGLHYRLSENKKTNEWVMKLFLAWPLFINPTVFRKKHAMHHKHLHTEDDPEFSRKDKSFWSFPMRPLRLITLLIMDITGCSLPFILFAHKGYLFSKGETVKSKFDLIRFTYYFLIIGMIIYSGLFLYFLLYWMIPIVTWGNLLIRIRRISEHCGLSLNEEMISRSRTTLTNILEKTFIAPCHVNFHNEHHLFPSVPYYKLPELHSFLMKNENYVKKVHVTKGYWNVFRECTS